MPSLLLLVHLAASRLAADLQAVRCRLEQQLFLLGANIHTILVEFA